MKQNLNREIFREYDVRGVVDKDLTPEIVHLLGRAIGTYAINHGRRRISVGRDCRLSSESYQQALTDGILSTGLDIIDIGLCATPMLYFSIRHLHTDGGVMITGSHNPSNYNGFKICMGPDTIYGEDIQELRNVIEKNDFCSGKGKICQINVAIDYQDYLFKNVAVGSSLKIVVDGGNGVGGYYALPILRRYGCEAIPLFCDPDGRFPNHFPDPTIPENLQELIRLVHANKADVGIAYDGDADRLGVITDQGGIIWGDELLLLFSRSILKKNPGATVIGEVKCSQNLYNDIVRNGGRAIMWKAGHSLIKGKMKEEEAQLAGEMSGHIFFADRYFGYDDAIYASLRLLEILSITGKSLSNLISDVPRTYATPEIRVDCPDALKFRVVEAVKEHYRTLHDIIVIDGVRISFGDGWGLLRASNTQPVLVLRFEATSRENLFAIRSDIEGVMNNILQSFN